MGSPAPTNTSPLYNLQEGDSVIYKNVGFDLTTYETADKDVVRIENGRLYTKTFDRDGGMQWDESRQCWKYDGGLGMVTYAIAADDQTALQWISENDEG